MICYMASTSQCVNKESKSNVASKPAPAMQGCTMTKNKHLTSLKAPPLPRVEVIGALQDLSNLKIINRTCFALKGYLTLLTEPTKLCQQDVTLTLGILNTAYICK